MLQFIFKNKFEIEPFTAYNGKLALDMVINNIQAIQEFKS